VRDTLNCSMLYSNVCGPGFSHSQPYKPSLAWEAIPIVVLGLLTVTGMALSWSQVDHESWHSALAHYHTRRNGYLKSWVAHRRNLLEKVAAIFCESQRVFGMKQHAKAEREQQRKICQELCAKVSRWRKERLEVMRVEAEVAARVREEEETRRRVEEETERRRRDRERVKVGVLGGGGNCRQL